MTKPKSSDTIEHFLFGDYDEDGVMNIDDPAPFDPDISEYPEIREDPEYYLQARFGSPDLLFSDVLLSIKHHNDSQAPILWDFLQQNPGAFGRVKSVPSTINKLYRKPVKASNGEEIFAIDTFKDIVGASLVMDNREQVYKMGDYINKSYDVIPGMSKDFYELNDRSDPYRGLHHTIRDKEGRRLEVQMRSKPFDDLSVQVHPYYKAGEDMSQFMDEVDRLIDEGF